MTDVLSAFPTRPLRARPPGLLTPFFRPLLGLNMFGTMLILALGLVLPDLVTDWQVRAVAVPIQGARLDHGSCDGKLMVNLCNVTITAPAGTERVTRKIDYLFGSFGDAPLRARVVGDPARPWLLTTNFGLERFWNRAVSLVIVCAVLAGLTGGAIWSMVGSFRTRRAWRQATLVPVPLRLLQAKGGVWTVQAENGREVRWSVSRFARPFVLGPDDHVLGLASRNGAVVPLDSRLRWVVLSRTERAAIRAAGAARAAG